MARILIVEDESLLRSLFSKIVGGQGHDVVSAASVDEAMALCRQQQPQLIIADWMLEGTGTGGDLARQVLTEFPGIKVIVITGHPGRFVFGDVDETNVVGVLAKPIEIDQFRAAVTVALAGK